MSVVKRIASGSAAAWLTMLVTMVAQVALVPVYLSFWDATIYGVWLSIQANYSLITIADNAHQNYLGAEFLKNINDKKEIGRILSDGLFVAVLLSIIALFVIVILLGLGVVDHAYESEYHSAVYICLVVHCVAWLMYGAIGGVIVRVLGAVQAYSRGAWWGLAVVLCNTTTPLIALLMGGGIREVGIVVAVTNGLTGIPLILDCIRVLKANGIQFAAPDFRAGVVRFFKSQFLTIQLASNFFRQHGSRLLLAPFAGGAGVAAFSLTRTGANLFLQALGNIANPIQAELMRYVANREQEKMEGAMAVIWLFIAFVVGPAMLIVHLIASPIFQWWTQGKVQFDPWLFGIFSVTVLLYAMSVPAATLLRCNNLLREQLIISVVSGILAVAGIALLTKLWGLYGAAIALLIAEVFALIANIAYARNWLSSVKLRWPIESFMTLIVYLIAVAIFLGLLSGFHSWRIALAIVGCLLSWGISLSYWYTIPQIVRERIGRALSRLTPSFNSK